VQNHIKMLFCNFCNHCTALFWQAAAFLPICNRKEGETRLKYVYLVLLPANLTVSSVTQDYMSVSGHMTAFVHYYWRLPQSKLASLPCLFKTIFCRPRLARLPFFIKSAGQVCRPSLPAKSASQVWSKFVMSDQVSDHVWILINCRSKYWQVWLKDQWHSNNNKAKCRPGGTLRVLAGKKPLTGINHRKQILSYTFFAIRKSEEDCFSLKKGLFVWEKPQL
jgi:hypothetical protein